MSTFRNCNQIVVSHANIHTTVLIQILWVIHIFKALKIQPSRLGYLWILSAIAVEQLILKNR